MSKIEWTGETWNPIVGCSLQSHGCKNCYAMGMAYRLEAIADAGANGLDHYRGLTEKSHAGQILWTGKIGIAPDDVLTKPLRWKKPRKIFVNSMSDLFHPDVPDDVIDRVFAVMALCPQHIFQVLTKRADRMRAYMSGLANEVECFERLGDGAAALVGNRGYNLAGEAPWPLPNVWLGVSVEDQARADERIPDLLAAPAAVRWLSCEPLLGPLDVNAISFGHSGCFSALDGHWRSWRLGQYGSQTVLHQMKDVPRLDWIVCGGESGKGARPMHPDWARSLRDQCADAGVPFFFKQWGDWVKYIDRERDDPDWRQNYREGPGFKWLNLEGGCGFHGERFHVMQRIGKSKAGRLLDGQLHDALPGGIA